MVIARTKIHEQRNSLVPSPEKRGGLPMNLDAHKVELPMLSEFIPARSNEGFCELSHQPVGLSESTLTINKNGVVVRIFSING